MSCTQQHSLHRDQKLLEVILDLARKLVINISMDVTPSMRPPEGMSAARRDPLRADLKTINLERFDAAKFMLLFPVDGIKRTESLSVKMPVDFHTNKFPQYWPSSPRRHLFSCVKWTLFVTGLQTDIVQVDSHGFAGQLRQPDLQICQPRLHSRLPGSTLCCGGAAIRL